MVDKVSEGSLSQKGTVGPGGEAAVDSDAAALDAEILSLLEDTRLPAADQALPKIPGAAPQPVSHEDVLALDADLLEQSGPVTEPASDALAAIASPLAPSEDLDKEILEQLVLQQVETPNNAVTSVGSSTETVPAPAEDAAVASLPVVELSSEPSSNVAPPHTDQAGAVAMPNAVAPAAAPIAMGTSSPAAPTPTLPAAPSVYLGLRAFTKADADRFLGRESEIERLVSAIDRSRLTILIGPSGSGKTSLVQAGILPRIERSSGDRWRSHYMRFGVNGRDDPFVALANGLVALTANFSSETEAQDALQLAQLLNAGTLRLRSVLEEWRHANPGNRLLLAVDDFDTVLNYTGDAALTRRFINVLLDAFQDQNDPFYLLIVLRAEALEQALQYRVLADAIDRYALHLFKPGRDELRRAIVEPARASNTLFDPDLVETILDAVEAAADGLPLMQFCLNELWLRRDQGGLGMEAFQAAGGVKDSVEQTLEAIWNERARSGRSATTADSFRRLFRGLSLANGSAARPFPKSSNDEGAWTLALELAALPNPIISITPDAGGEVAELAHESILRHWARPSQWRTEDGLFEEWLRNLAPSIEAWKQDPNSEDKLLKGPALAQAEDWLSRRPDGFKAAERAFVERSVADRKQKEEDQRRAADREVEQAQQMRTQADDLAEARSREAEESVRRVRRNRLVATAAIMLSMGSVGLTFLSWLQLGTVRTRFREAEQMIAVAQRTAGEARERETDARKTAERAVVRARELAEDRTAMIVGLALRDIAEKRVERGLMVAMEARPKQVEGGKIGEFPRLASAIEKARYAGLPLAQHDLRKFNLSVAWSPDGKSLLTANDDRKATLWNAESGQQIRALVGHREAVLAARFDREGMRALTASEDGTARIWMIESGAELAVLGPHPMPVSDAAFSPDGRLVATACDDGIVRLWEAATWTQIKSFVGHSAAVRSVAFSPDGKKLVSGSGDRTVRIWDIENGAELRMLRGHSQVVNMVRFDPSGAKIVSASADRTVRIWDADKGGELRTLQGHTDRVTSIALTSDGAELISASADRSIRIWNLATGAVVRQIDIDGPGAAEAVPNSDGQIFAVATSAGTVQLLDAATGKLRQLLAGHVDKLRSAAVSTAAARLVTGGDDGAVIIWGSSNGNQVRRHVGHNGAVNSVAISSDGETVISGGSDRSVRVWRSQNGNQVLSGHNGEVLRVAVSDDGRRAASLGTDRSIRVWDVPSQRELRSFANLPLTASLALDPAGERLAAGLADGALRVWEVVTGRELHSIATGWKQIETVTFSADGSMILAGSGEGAVAAWKAADASMLRSSTTRRQAVSALKTSADGRRIVAGFDDGGIQIGQLPDTSDIPINAGNSQPAIVGIGFVSGGRQIYAVNSAGSLAMYSSEHGFELLRIAGHGGPLTGVAVAPDGQTIASSAEDRTVRFWNAMTGGELRRAVEFTRPVTAIAISSRGDRTAAAATDGTVRLWDASGAAIRTIAGQGASVSALMFSPKGDRLVSGGDDRNIRIVDAGNGAEIRRIQIGGGSVRAISMSPDGRRIAVGSGDSIARIWDVDSGRQAGALVGHAGPVRALAFGPEGYPIATGSDDGTVRLWHASNLSAGLVLRGHSGPVTAVAFAAGGRRLLSASEDRTIALWDTATGILLHRFAGHTGAIAGLAVLPDSRRFVSASVDRSARVWGIFDFGEAWDPGFVDRLRPLTSEERRAALQSE